MELRKNMSMRIWYQNGAILEGVMLHRTEESMRVAVKGRDDVMDVHNVHGTWVSDECEPVIMEIGASYKTGMEYSDEEFICPRSLADQLISLLVEDSADDMLDEQTPLRTVRPGISTLIA